MNSEKSQSHSSMPLVSRLDRLDSIMKYIEGKQSITKWRSKQHGGLVGGVKRQFMPLDLALIEAHSKGSLLDRVTSLENRLVQLCLEIESSSSKVQCINGRSSSSLINGSSKRKQSSSSSFPTFYKTSNVMKPQPQVQFNRLEFQRKSHRQQEKVKQTSPQKQQLGKNRDEKTCKSGNKGMNSNWPHLNILGC